MKKLVALLLTLTLTFTLLTGCGAKPADNGAAGETTPATTIAPEDMKVGFIYIGPAGDGGWSMSHDLGRQYLEKELGVKTTYQESVPVSQECEKVMRAMIDDGAKIVVANSYGYGDYMANVAKEFPDVVFLHCSGSLLSDNMANFFGRIEEARYLSGMVAGMKTKTNKLGYVAAYEIPEVVRGINAFTLGVRAVNPQATVDVMWTHTWYDPAKEKDAALALLDQGCDVIAQHQDTAGPMQAAEERGAFAVGYNMPALDKAPKAYLTAPVWNWGPYYVDQTRKVMEGTWKAESYWGGMNDGIVELDALSANAPEGAQAKVDEYMAKIKDGSFKPFQGPIKDQSGAVKVPEGQVLSDADQLSCDWFVEGVIGKVK